MTFSNFRFAMHLKQIPKAQLLNLSGAFRLPLTEPHFVAVVSLQVQLNLLLWSATPHVVEVKQENQTWIPGSIPLSVLLHSKALNASHELLESKRCKKGHNNNIQRGLSFSCDEDGITCKGKQNNLARTAVQ